MSDEFAKWQQEVSDARSSVDVCFDRELLFAFEQAQRDAEAESGMLSADRARVEELRDQVKAKTRTLVFKSLGKGGWRRLEAQYPPTPEQIEKFGQLDHNPETFPAAAMSECCIDPGMSKTQAEWLCDTFPMAVVDRVWATVLEANLLGGDEKKVATARPFDGEKRSTPPSPMESLGASS